MHTRIRLSGLLAGLSAVTFAMACGDGTGPATARNNPGTGTSTLKVTADIDANDDPSVIGGFSNDYTVTVRDGASNPVSGATVTIKNVALGTITLPETVTGTGDYSLTGNTFPAGDFRLDVVKGTGHGVGLATPELDREVLGFALRVIAHEQLGVLADVVVHARDELVHRLIDQQG